MVQPVASQMEGLGHHIDHGGGDLLMTGGVRMIAVAGEVTGFVIGVIRVPLKAARGQRRPASIGAVVLITSFT